MRPALMTDPGSYLGFLPLPGLAFVLSDHCIYLKPRFLTRNTGPLFYLHFWLHTPFSVQVYKYLLNACFVIFTMLGAENVKVILFFKKNL